MRSRDPRELINGVVNGDKTALARLLSVVEQGGERARLAATLAYPLGGNTYTIGLTGAPGAGKSTLTDRLIAAARGDGDSVAVLAIDPSSPFSGGAILGDRVRMSDHFLDPGVFIRSMATRGHLGGLAIAAPEAVRVLDAAGFPWVLLETVGVGQVEVEIAGAADTTVVVVNPGWGDSVQANKAGLLEIADIFVINKSDRAGAQQTENDLMGMLELSGIAAQAWRPPIVRTVATFSPDTRNCTGNPTGGPFSSLEMRPRKSGKPSSNNPSRRVRTFSRSSMLFAISTTCAKFACCSCWSSGR